MYWSVTNFVNLFEGVRREGDRDAPRKYKHKVFSRVLTLHNNYIIQWLYDVLSSSHRGRETLTVYTSVADPGCLSRILIFTHPGSRIPDPKTATKERAEKNLLHLFLMPQISQNFKLFLFLNCRRKTFWPNFKEF
jgi:hypothetical protein